MSHVKTGRVEAAYYVALTVYKWFSIDAMVRGTPPN